MTGGTARSIGGYTATSEGATVGTDWLSAGAGLKFELSQGWSFLTDYEGVFFRADAGQHFGSAELRVVGGTGKALGNPSCPTLIHEENSRCPDIHPVDGIPNGILKIFTIKSQKYVGLRRKGGQQNGAILALGKNQQFVQGQGIRLDFEAWLNDVFPCGQSISREFGQVFHGF